MKKLILLLCSLFLLGCQDVKQASVSKPALIDDEEVEQVVEEIEHIEENDLKSLVLNANSILSVIDIVELHDRISRILDDVVDFSESNEKQDALIEEIVYDELDTWRREVIKGVISEAGMTVGNKDFESIVSRTSIEVTYEIMLSYEKLYIKGKRGDQDE